MKDSDKEYVVYLDDILDSISKIEFYLQDLDANAFAQNSGIQDAVMRRLEIIGEAVKRLPEEVKGKYAEIPWKNIAGMRDILIHEYAGVQLERIWRTAQDDLAPLKQVAQQMRAEK